MHMVVEKSQAVINSSDLPDFIEKKLRQCDDEMFRPRKNKKPLVLGDRLPDAGSIMLQSNDYLNISNHSRIRKAQLEMLTAMNREPLMSAVFLHEDSAMNQFEKKMALFTGFESSILCQSGWSANVGLLQVIADPTVPVYIDFFAHMSLWDGIKIAGATPYAFRHNDAAHLDRLISEYGQGIVVFDSLYSTSGEIAPIRELVEVTNRHGCVSVVDESHSLGTHGKQGAGLINEYGMSDQVHFITASLAKAFAGRAGIILCPSRLSKYYPFLASPSIFSSTLLDYEIAGLNATLDVIIKGDDRRKALREKSRYFRTGLSSLGYSIASESQIVSILSGLEPDTEKLRDALEARNIFGSAFMAPATPRTRSLMRFSIHSGLTMEELDYVLNVCEDIRDEIGMWKWKSTRKNKASH
ncbi:quorum-sensing autoinducer synthase [Chlorobaculum thiosulfatiphilum]|uniref:Quorum-sensing autoinducer synthase n=2 Tax=Chlorobaculum thiosulfatiphilum TaxID=115852 RepID=A0A5C4S1N1_CHLTI|nr:quorum-sensing autoinducer synthase [Chlorobaculum thiosulfatiphilum]